MTVYAGAVAVASPTLGVVGETTSLYDGTTAIGTATVGTNGTWSLKVRLGVGTLSVWATQTLMPGVTSLASAAILITVLRLPPGRGRGGEARTRRWSRQPLRKR